MRYTIEIDTDNAAFEHQSGTEIARILRQLADRCGVYTEYPAVGSLRDLNGNIVGSALYGPVPTDGNEPRF